MGAGKVARTLAGRCSIAARLDAYEGTPMTAEDVAEVEAKVLAIRAAHPRPPSRKGGADHGTCLGKATRAPTHRCRADGRSCAVDVVRQSWRYGLRRNAAEGQARRVATVGPSSLQGRLRTAPHLRRCGASPPRARRSCALPGAGHGTTVSHIHDVVCHGGAPGRVVAVDLSPRCLRDLTRLSHARPGLVPVLGDARRPEAWRAWLPRRASWVFQDVAQAHQASIFTSACARFLVPGGRGLLSLKVESDRGTDADGLRVKVEHELADAGLILEEVIDLEGFEDKHLLFVVGRPPRA